jgi:hypothetical protein
MTGGLGDRSRDQAFEQLLRLASESQARQRQLLARGETVPWRLPVDSTLFTARILSTAAEVHALTPFVNSLLPQPGMLAPRFFLASLLPRHCRPCVVVVSQGHRVAGLLYAGERLLAGIPTGIVLGDDTLGTMVVARPEEMDSVMHCALETLLKHRAALRFWVNSDRLALLQAETAKANAEGHYYQEEHHAHLELPRTYDEFLAKVRNPTRHNFRYYRRRSELAGNEFCRDQAFPDFCTAAKRLRRVHLLVKRTFQQRLAMIEASSPRFLVGLRRRGGEWISVAGGWYVGDSAFLALQLNDRSRERESLSIVLRSYLIEHLINRGIRDLIFWTGTAAPLRFYTTPREEFTVFIDSRSLPWRLVRLGCITLAKLAPAAFGGWLRWQSPDADARLRA